jgi:hypothetical protein
MVTNYRCFLYCNTTKKDNGNVQWHITIIFFFSNIKNTKHAKKQQQKNQEKGGSLPSSSHFALSLWAPTFALLLLPFCFKCFLLTATSALSLLAPNHALAFLPSHF